jgi:hypothetical protein
MVGVPASPKVTVVFAPVAGSNVAPGSVQDHVYVSEAVLVAEPVKLAVVPVIGVAVLTVIVTPVGVPGAAMTVTAALPETVDVGSVAVTVGLPAEVPVNWAPLSVVSAVIVPLPDVVQVNDGWVASAAPFWS